MPSCLGNRIALIMVIMGLYVLLGCKHLGGSPDYISERDYAVQTDTDTSKGVGERLSHYALVQIAGHATHNNKYILISGNRD